MPVKSRDLKSAAAALGDFQRAKAEAGWKNPPRVVYVVENKLILDQAVEAFQRELGLKRIAKVYGDDAHEAIDAEAEMIACSVSVRSGSVVPTSSLPGRVISI